MSVMTVDVLLSEFAALTDMSTIAEVFRPRAREGAAAARRADATTNAAAHVSALVDARAREAINHGLSALGAAPLRATHTSESVARKAIRMALRDIGYAPDHARELASSLVRDAR